MRLLWSRVSAGLAVVTLWRKLTCTTWIRDDEMMTLTAMVVLLRMELADCRPFPRRGWRAKTRLSHDGVCLYFFFTRPEKRRDVTSGGWAPGAMVGSAKIARAARRGLATKAGKLGNVISCEARASIAAGISARAR